MAGARRKQDFNAKLQIQPAFWQDQLFAICSVLYGYELSLIAHYRNETVKIWYEPGLYEPGLAAVNLWTEN